jgi:hypothetical protein
MKVKQPVTPNNQKHKGPMPTARFIQNSSTSGFESEENSQTRNRNNEIAKAIHRKTKNA